MLIGRQIKCAEDDLYVYANVKRTSNERKRRRGREDRRDRSADGSRSVQLRADFSSGLRRRDAMFHRAGNHAIKSHVNSVNFLTESRKRSTTGVFRSS